MSKTTFVLSLADAEGTVINQWKINDVFSWDDDETEILFSEESIGPSTRAFLIESIGDEVLNEITSAISRRPSKGDVI